ncbi:hypothetical protein [Aliarcobacter cryaerophilus]|uniref:hypothetical protein n=1 Tax=Aliarcobacter cryaerophilus TaxID=28198 RepID=UPI0021B6CE8D|nr:hypothetical protein [Aliarcobacter cryaerophilus]MCT7405022.1 hypothetical protein [Aliarcobacter cryaerophilus]MCT7502937.1 hypothetical protein [Aliarcobacter cryaerophilus]
MRMMYLNNIIDKYDVLRLNSIQNINELQELYSEILQTIRTIEDRNQPKDKNFLSILNWLELEVLYEIETALCSYSESGGA